MRIRMSPKEADLFKAFVDKSQGYFEFGIGGSTFYAGSVVKGPVRAVDSDMAWIEAAEQSMPASQYERLLKYVDIGPTKEWGHPVSTDEKEKFSSYHGSIIGNTQNIDLCLVDGRFRVACFLQALLVLDSDAIIGFHDYRSRKYYHSVENFARPIAESQDMSFFVRRKDANFDDIRAALSETEHNPE